MTGYELKFDITENTQIVIDFEADLLAICYDCYDPVMLFHNGKSIMLAKYLSYFNIRDFRDILQQALNGELLLHESITSDIGYLSNGYCYNEMGFATEDRDMGKYCPWVGWRYQFWYSNENERGYYTWIYNDHNGNIVFEVTPSYSYFHCDIKKQKHFIPFKKWMMQYKPYLVATLTSEKGQKLLDQANEFIKSIDDNMARFKENERQGRVFNDPY